jgi:photosystem II oxygen-evolving enhancer protein 3
VYGNVAENPNYDPNNKEYSERKMKVLTETRLRLQKLPRYVNRKEWFNVSDELARFMYETRGAARGLAKSPEQKKAATDFFKAIEATDLAARRKKQAECSTAAADTVVKLDAFISTL